MGRRAPSPARSENEVDILGALVDESEDGHTNTGAKPNDMELDFGDILNAGAGDGNESDGDAAFIASTQRSSNRKNTNVQGKSVKKGGGFQSMGMPFAIFYSQRPQLTSSRS